MKPYSISCTTCGARLKVRDERAIGELSLCPKCGSMVMVTPPAPGADASSSGVGIIAPRGPAPSDSSRQLVVGKRSIGNDFDDAAALFADTVDDVAAAKAPEQRAAGAAKAHPKVEHAKPQAAVQPAVTQARQQAPSPPPIAPPPASMSSIELDPKSASSVAVASPLEKAATVAAAVGNGKQPEVEATSQADNLHVAAAADSPQTHAAPLPGYGEEVWTTPSQQLWRRYALIGAAVLAAALLVGSVLGFILQKPHRPTQAVAAHTDTQNPPAADRPDGDADGKLPRTTGASDPADPPQPWPADADTNPPAATDPPVADDPPTVPMPADPEAPLGDPGVEPGVSGEEDPSADPPNAETGLGELTPLVDAFPVPPTPTPMPPDEAAPADPGPATPPSRPRPEPLAVDVPARLADKIDGIDAGGAPLVKFIELITQLSTIPITLDPDALAQTKASPRSPVSLVVDKPATIEELFEKALAELSDNKLTYEIRGEQIVVVASRGKDMLKVPHPVDDLAVDEPAKKDLADHLRALAAPDSWDIAGGKGTIEIAEKTLDVTNTQAAHFAVHVLLQKLRVARGLAPRSKLDPGMFAAASRTSRAAARLNTSMRATFYAERPLTRILAHLEKAAGATILVDWESLLEAGWPPHSTATLVIDGQPLAAALEELLTPMDLTWRAIDEDTLQVTSRAALESRAELEFYTIGKLLDKGRTLEAIIAGIETELGRDAFVKHGGTFDVRYDAPSKSLLVRMPQAQQRVVERHLTSAAE